MQKYIVGGHVRDQILGRTSGDKDWVVVGGNHDLMEQLGFIRVGKAFPVYLNPNTGEEYALARQERKVAPGHDGFAFDTETVTLEQDLPRRDLTINAIARCTDGDIIDPCGGYRDIQSRLLRHISPAFSDDPLRVLRVARFAAQLASFGFRCSTDTLDLMRIISASGELQTLPAERVCQETIKALASDSPSVYFMILRKVGALSVLFPEIERLFGVPQKAQYHPEVDTGIHLMMVLDQSAKLCASEDVRFACLCHDLGKSLTPEDEWPAHKKHEIRGVPLVRSLCNRLKAKASIKRLSLLVCEYHLLGHRAFELRPRTLVKLFNKLDAWRRPETLYNFAICCEADSRGRAGFENAPFPQRAFLLDLFDHIQQNNSIPEAEFTGLKGVDIKEYIFEQRCKLANQFIAMRRSK